ncbi:transcriptional regulator [Aggregatibacter aphrophilus]|jgi:ner|uniref:Nlp family transcripitonal regulator n=1 Tax=Haemophilus parainfluenzae TaxID=729 RepID=A0A3S4V9X5_HAEPA|nr:MULTISPECIES: helix-turn-helix domain-containing protein [Pasteurellaceae]DAJ59287.1 MAG TPA: putative transcriptional regulator [Caudoviricetes sp.]DAK08472.1 MAG TPA: putative transcriptional regulator [Bacteriophage sp.]HDR1845220.1 helix-turn-helix domain-containing protein [Pasteurella multocida]AKU62961.1 transcriptional regulator [Aggregatibacter aphrophilus]VEI30420.1 Nlp family transcripitonal regulator [Haemophilus parainfluenzae]
MKKSKKDMHRAFIVAMIKEKGKTLSQLSIEAGLHPRTLGNVLDRKYPKGEKIIADFVGMKPEEIWPTRYE